MLAGGAVSWRSRLQNCIMQSTTEVEYVAVMEACKEAIWLGRLVADLEIKIEMPKLHCDSQSAIHLSKNSSFHLRSKHIDARYHWVRDVLEKKLLELNKVHTEKNVSDMLTKVVTKDKHLFCRSGAGMENFVSNSV